MRSIVALAAACMTVIAVHASDTLQTRWLKYLMGTSVRVEINTGDATAREQAAAEMFGAVREVDRLMSDYRADSELSLVNARGAQSAVPVSAPLLAVLEAAQRVSRASNGAFDVTVGPLVQLWGFKTKTPHVPSPGELNALRDRIDYRLLLIDAESSTVRFARQGMQIDLGGIAKGFAAEVAAGSLSRRGLHGMIDLGGNQYFVGEPPGKSSWTVGIRHPDRPDAVLGAVEITGGSLSTSADTSNFLVAEGLKYGHLLDPRTLKPANASLSATVVSKDGTLADALSKAVFVLGPQAGLELLASFPGTEALIAYRRQDGGVGIVRSPGLVFHPAAS